MMPALRNKINADFIRRVLIGSLIGLVLIGLWSSIATDNSRGQNSDGILDSEIVKIPNASLLSNNDAALEDDTTLPTPPSENDIETNLPSIDDASSESEIENNLYLSFSKFKAPLNSSQKTAIDDGAPVLSIILTGIGSNKALNDAIIEKLSNNVTLSLSPYLKDHNAIATKFSEYGFETWMDIAAITYDRNYDHGPLALNPVNNLDNNITLLSRQLENKDRITGVILPSQSLIIETPSLWENLVNDIYAEGYGIVDNTTQVMKPALYFFNENRAPYIKGDRSFSNEMTLEQYSQALSNLRKSVKDQGNMVVTIPILSFATLDIIDDWADSLSSDGITLVPVSAQAKL